MSTNLLLNSLPADELQVLERHLERVQFKHHDVLMDPDEAISWVFFPQTCMISLVTVLSDGSSIEAATVGNEGVVGLAVFLGLESVNTKAVCQIDGDALRMRSDAFQDAISAGVGLHAALGLYTHAFIAMLAQGGACNGSHSIEQRLARWLLTVADRVSSDKFYITQEFLAQMLGAQRPTVTVIAQVLRDAGLIEYRHGHVGIQNREGLQNRACECYEIIRRLYEETFRSVPAKIVKLSSNGWAVPKQSAV